MDGPGECRHLAGNLSSVVVATDETRDIVSGPKPLNCLGRFDPLPEINQRKALGTGSEDGLLQQTVDAVEHRLRQRTASFRRPIQGLRQRLYLLSERFDVFCIL